MPQTSERIETRISPDWLDTIGNAFNFSHGKGAAEWLKNSLDNYLRRNEQGLEAVNSGWLTILSLLDGSGRSSGPNLAVVDFGGAMFTDVQDFFLYWGDRGAATLGGRVGQGIVTGGHGNGGKFYMRQMWRNGARFFTWKNGRATSLVVEKRTDGTTGYWEISNEEMSWKRAITSAMDVENSSTNAEYIIDYLESERTDIVTELDTEQRGFTVALGLAARQVRSSNDVVISSGRWDAQRLIDDLRNATQARRPIQELYIPVFLNGQLRLERLEPEPIEEDTEWPAYEWNIPTSILGCLNESDSIDSIGTFSLRKAADPLTGRRRRQYNEIAVIDENNNPVAHYPVRELPIPGSSAMLTFMHGEVFLSSDCIEELIQNDRERLVDSEITQALLEWVAERIWERVSEFEDQQRAIARNRNLELASMLNNSLNEHAKRFLEEVETEIMVDFIEDEEGGGAGAAGNGTGPTGSGPGGTGTRTSGTGGTAGSGGSLETSGSTERVRRPRFPQVLISGLDPDPAAPDGETKLLTDRHPPLHQDDMDRQWNVWWINADHPFAAVAFQRGGAQGLPFRSYQLFMFLQVVERETLRIRERRDAEIGLDEVENELSDISNRFLAQLPRDLVNELTS